MLNLSFHSNDTSTLLIEAVDDYRGIWESDGDRIQKAMESATGLLFPKGQVEVIVYEGISKSGTQDEPMMLRGSYPYDTKRATLIHELGHRLLDANYILAPDAGDSHQLINLFLYDVWTELFGSQYADEQVAVEKMRSERYLKCWEWALAMNTGERKQRLSAAVELK